MLNLGDSPGVVPWCNRTTLGFKPSLSCWCSAGNEGMTATNHPFPVVSFKGIPKTISNPQHPDSVIPYLSRKEHPWTKVVGKDIGAGGVKEGALQPFSPEGLASGFGLPPPLPPPSTPGRPAGARLGGAAEPGEPRAVRPSKGRP